MAHIQELDKGKYKLVVSLGYDAKGKKIRKTKTVTASGPREAKKKLAEFETEVYNNNYVDVKDMPFTQFVDTWREEYASKKLSLSTQEVYNDILDSSIIPYFESKRMKDIKTLHLEKFFNDEEKEGKGSLEKKYNLLNGMFGKAVDWEVIASNPMNKVEKPKKPKKKKDFYNKSEIQTLLSRIDTLPLYQRTIIKMAVIGGLRRGEILALTINEVSGNEVKIYRNLQHTKKGGTVLKETKTGEERTVTLPGHLIDDLKSLHKQQLEYKIGAGNLWQGFNGEIMLFANEFGVPFQPHSISTFWRRFINREGLKKISFHDLRHSSASLLISEGINMKVVQQRLGHKDIKTTLNIYSHVTKKDDEKASAIFDSISNENGH
jgi:integrase